MGTGNSGRTFGPVDSSTLPGNGILSEKSSTSPRVFQYTTTTHDLLFGDGVGGGQRQGEPNSVHPDAYHEIETSM